MEADPLLEPGPTCHPQNMAEWPCHLQSRAGKVMQLPAVPLGWRSGGSHRMGSSDRRPPSPRPHVPAPGTSRGPPPCRLGAGAPLQLSLLTHTLWAGERSCLLRRLPTPKSTLAHRRGHSRPNGMSSSGVQQGDRCFCFSSCCKPASFPWSAECHTFHIFVWFLLVVILLIK